MANLFDIFNKKASRSSSVSDNEQVSRFGARPPNSGDGRDGVNNPHSPFENKDGVKGSGNMPAFPDARFEKQEATSPFTIPKLKKIQKDLLTEISLDSREWQQEILPAILKHFRNSSSSSKFDFFKVFTVHSAERTQQYLEKRREMRQNGYSDREVADSFAFICLDDDRQVEKVCRDGLAIGNLTNSTIGHPGMGVQLCRYIDYLLPVPFPPVMTGKLVVFKIMKGRLKAVPENRTGTYLEPTPNCDSHIAKPGIDPASSSHLQLYESNQIYLFEYGDLSVEKVPRHVLPYAVVHFRYKEVMPVIKVTDSPPVMSPKIQSPLGSARLSASSVKDVEDPEYVIWCGRLKVKDLLDCQVKMVSTASTYKPARLGTMLDLKFSCDMKAAAERYFGELTCLRKGGEVYWKGWYINVAELRPRPDSKALFQRLRNYLCKTDTVAVVKPENDTILLLVPDSNLTADLGLSRQHHFPVMLHCIFLSRQSAKFKSPRYLFKAMQNRGSGCSTPRRDRGPLSPLHISIHSAPPSPVMSPLSGSAAVHSMPQPSPTFRSSQRKEGELAIWAGAGRTGAPSARGARIQTLSASPLPPNPHLPITTPLSVPFPSLSVSPLPSNPLLPTTTPLSVPIASLSLSSDPHLSITSPVSFSAHLPVTFPASVPYSLSVSSGSSSSVCQASEARLPNASPTSVPVLSVSSAVSVPVSSLSVTIVSVPSISVSLASEEARDTGIEGTDAHSQSNFSTPGRCPASLALNTEKLSLNTDKIPSVQLSPVSPVKGPKYSPVTPVSISSPFFSFLSTSGANNNPLQSSAALSPLSAYHSPVDRSSMLPSGSLSSVIQRLHGIMAMQTMMSSVTPSNISSITPSNILSVTCSNRTPQLSSSRQTPHLLLPSDNSSHSLPSPKSPYSPISPASPVPSSIPAFPRFLLQQFSTDVLGGATKSSMQTASSLLSAASGQSSSLLLKGGSDVAPLHASSSSLGCRRSSDFVGDGGGGGRHAPDDRGTCLLSPNRTSRRASLSAESDQGANVPALAHNLMRLHRSLSTDLASHEGSPSHRSIPLGYDEGFLMYTPSSALVNADRLHNAFEIQRQIQEEIEASAVYHPVGKESLAVPVPSIMVSSSPPFSREQPRDVVQDDNITSSTSHDHSTGASKPRSPAASPDKVTDSDIQGAEDAGRGLLKSSSSPSLTSRESQPRSRNIYLPPPGTPVYIPTPVSHEPPAKKSKLEEPSRYSSPSYYSDRRSPYGSAGSGQRPSALKVPSSQPLGLLQSRTGREFPPLPMSPADSSTDKAKPPTPQNANIDTADDMKNFLNAVLERKPSTVKSPSASRGLSSTASVMEQQSVFPPSDCCALPSFAETGPSLIRTTTTESKARQYVSNDNQNSTFVPSTETLAPVHHLHQSSSEPSLSIYPLSAFAHGSAGDSISHREASTVRRHNVASLAQRPSIIVHIPAAVLRGTHSVCFSQTSHNQSAVNNSPFQVPGASSTTQSPKGGGEHEPYHDLSNCHTLPSTPASNLREINTSLKSEVGAEVEDDLTDCSVHVLHKILPEQIERGCPGPNGDLMQSCESVRVQGISFEDFVEEPSHQTMFRSSTHTVPNPLYKSCTEPSKENHLYSQHEESASDRVHSMAPASHVSRPMITFGLSDPAGDNLPQSCGTSKVNRSEYTFCRTTLNLQKVVLQLRSLEKKHSASSESGKPSNSEVDGSKDLFPNGSEHLGGPDWQGLSLQNSSCKAATCELSKEDKADRTSAPQEENHLGDTVPVTSEHKPVADSSTDEKYERITLKLNLSKIMESVKTVSHGRLHKKRKENAKETGSKHKTEESSKAKEKKQSSHVSRKKWDVGAGREKDTELYSSFLDKYWQKPSGTGVEVMVCHRDNETTSVLPKIFKPASSAASCSTASSQPGPASTVSDDQDKNSDEKDLSSATAFRFDTGQRNDIILSKTSSARHVNSCPEEKPPSVGDVRASGKKPPDATVLAADTALSVSSEKTTSPYDAYTLKPCSVVLEDIRKTLKPPFVSVKKHKSGRHRMHFKKTDQLLKVDASEVMAGEENKHSEAQKTHTEAKRTTKSDQKREKKTKHLKAETVPKCEQQEKRNDTNHESKEMAGHTDTTAKQSKSDTTVPKDHRSSAKMSGTVKKQKSCTSLTDSKVLQSIAKKTKSVVNHAGSSGTKSVYLEANKKERLKHAHDISAKNDDTCKTSKTVRKPESRLVKKEVKLGQRAFIVTNSSWEAVRNQMTTATADTTGKVASHEKVSSLPRIPKISKVTSTEGETVPDVKCDEEQGSSSCTQGAKENRAASNYVPQSTFSKSVDQPLHSATVWMDLGEKNLPEKLPPQDYRKQKETLDNVPKPVKTSVPETSSVAFWIPSGDLQNAVKQIAERKAQQNAATLLSTQMCSESSVSRDSTSAKTNRPCSRAATAVLTDATDGTALQKGVQETKKGAAAVQKPWFPSSLLQEVVKHIAQSKDTQKTSVEVDDKQACLPSTESRPFTEKTQTSSAAASMGDNQALLMANKPGTEENPGISQESHPDPYSPVLPRKDTPYLIMPQAESRPDKEVGEEEDFECGWPPEDCIVLDSYESDGFCQTVSPGLGISFTFPENAPKDKVTRKSDPSELLALPSSKACSDSDPAMRRRANSDSQKHTPRQMGLLSIVAKAVIEAIEENQKNESSRNKRLKEKSSERDRDDRPSGHSLHRSRSSSLRSRSRSPSLRGDSRTDRRSKDSKSRSPSRTRDRDQARCSSGTTQKSRSPARSRSRQSVEKSESRSSLEGQPRSRSPSVPRSSHADKGSGSNQQSSSKTTQKTAGRDEDKMSSRTSDQDRRAEDRDRRTEDRDRRSEDRHSRRYHPYSRLEGRSERGPYRKPVASFELAYRDLAELLECKTVSMFKKRTDAKNDQQKQSRSTCSNIRRFCNYHFQRSAVPDTEEEPQAAEDPAPETEEGLSDECKELDRSLQAEMLDEILGETEAEAAEQEKSREQSCKVVSNNPEETAVHAVDDNSKSTVQSSISDESQNEDLNLLRLNTLCSRRGRTKTVTSGDTRTVLVSESLENLAVLESVSGTSVESTHPAPTTDLDRAEDKDTGSFSTIPSTTGQDRVDEEGSSSFSTTVPSTHLRGVLSGAKRVSTGKTQKAVLCKVPSVENFVSDPSVSGLHDKMEPGGQKIPTWVSSCGWQRRKSGSAADGSEYHGPATLHIISTCDSTSAEHATQNKEETDMKEHGPKTPPLSPRPVIGPRTPPEPYPAKDFVRSKSVTAPFSEPATEPSVKELSDQSPRARDYSKQLHENISLPGLKAVLQSTSSLLTLSGLKAVLKTVHDVTASETACQLSTAAATSAGSVQTHMYGSGNVQETQKSTSSSSGLCVETSRKDDIKCSHTATCRITQSTSTTQRQSRVPYIPLSAPCVKSDHVQQLAACMPGPSQSQARPYIRVPVQSSVGLGHYQSRAPLSVPPPNQYPADTHSESLRPSPPENVQPVNPSAPKLPSTQQSGGQCGAEKVSQKLVSEALSTAVAVLATAVKNIREPCPGSTSSGLSYVSQPVLPSLLPQPSVEPRKRLLSSDSDQTTETPTPGNLQTHVTPDMREKAHGKKHHKEGREPKKEPGKGKKSRKICMVNLQPWKLRYWPCVLIPITFVQRDTDYKPNNSLDGYKLLSVSHGGPDPRKNPDRPQFLPGRLSALAKAEEKKKKARLKRMASPKTTKEIPLDIVTVPGQRGPADPRHPFKRADVTEMMDSDGEERVTASVAVESRLKDNTEHMKPVSETQTPYMPECPLGEEPTQSDSSSPDLQIQSENAAESKKISACSSSGSPVCKFGRETFEHSPQKKEIRTSQHLGFSLPDISLAKRHLSTESGSPVPKKIHRSSDEKSKSETMGSRPSKQGTDGRRSVVSQSKPKISSQQEEEDSYIQSLNQELLWDVAQDLNLSPEADKEIPLLTVRPQSDGLKNKRSEYFSHSEVVIPGLGDTLTEIPVLTVHSQGDSLKNKCPEYFSQSEVVIPGLGDMNTEIPLLTVQPQTDAEKSNIMECSSPSVVVIPGIGDFETEQMMDTAKPSSNVSKKGYKHGSTATSATDEPACSTSLVSDTDLLTPKKSDENLPGKSSANASTSRSDKSFNASAEIKTAGTALGLLAAYDTDTSFSDMNSSHESASRSCDGQDDKSGANNSSTAHDAENIKTQSVIGKSNCCTINDAEDSETQLISEDVSAILVHAPTDGVTITDPHNSGSNVTVACQNVPAVCIKREPLSDFAQNRCVSGVYTARGDLAAVVKEESSARLVDIVVHVDHLGNKQILRRANIGPELVSDSVKQEPRTTSPKKPGDPITSSSELRVTLESLGEAGNSTSASDEPGYGPETNESSRGTGSSGKSGLTSNSTSEGGVRLTTSSEPGVKISGRSLVQSVEPWAHVRSPSTLRAPVTSPDEPGVRFSSKPLVQLTEPGAHKRSSSTLPALETSQLLAPVTSLSKPVTSLPSDPRPRLVSPTGTEVRMRLSSDPLIRMKSVSSPSEPGIRTKLQSEPAVRMKSSNKAEARIASPNDTGARMPSPSISEPQLSSPGEAGIGIKPVGEPGAKIRPPCEPETRIRPRAEVEVGIRARVPGPRVRAPNEPGPRIVPNEPGPKIRPPTEPGPRIRPLFEPGVGRGRGGMMRPPMASLFGPRPLMPPGFGVTRPGVIPPFGGLGNLQGYPGLLMRYQNEMRFRFRAPNQTGPRHWPR